MSLISDNRINFSYDGELNPKNILTTGYFPDGQYSGVFNDGSDTYIYRDSLGINKLFYGPNRQGDILFANQLTDLLKREVTYNNILSCPAGQILKKKGKIFQKIHGVSISTIKPDVPFNLKKFRTIVSDRLTYAFKYLSENIAKNKTVYVCLSGGLDSTIIFHFAKRFFKKIKIVSFSFVNDADFLSYSQKKKPLKKLTLSDDFIAAKKIAAKEKIDFLAVIRPYRSILTVLESVLRYGQDWRDFNVHCAIINWFIGESIKKDCISSQDALVVTGDLMNEFVADYREEKINGQIFYQQMKSPTNVRRRFFVQGLDAGDREIGIFSAFDLSAIQPYASVAQQYMKVPPKILDKIDCKLLLNKNLLGKRLKNFDLRNKTRAQVGGKDLGVLGYCQKNRISQEVLFNKWLHLTNSSRIIAQNLIQVGKYRFN